MPSRTVVQVAAASASALAMFGLALLPMASSAVSAASVHHLSGHLNITPRALTAGSGAVPVNPATPWTFGIVLPAADAAGLAAYAQAVSDPASAQYGQYLTAAQVQSRYGPPAALVGQLEAYLGHRGFATALAGQILNVSGSVAQVNSLFATQLAASTPPPDQGPPGGPGGTRGHKGGPRTPTFLEGPDSTLSIPSVLQSAIGLTGLVRGDLTPLGSALTLAAAHEVTAVSAATLPPSPPGQTGQASNGPFTVTAKLLDNGPLAPGLAAHWLITATLDGAPDASAAFTAMSGAFEGAPGFVDSTLTNQAGQFVLDTTMAVAQAPRLAIAVISDNNPADTSAVTVTLALPVPHFVGPSVLGCPLGPGGATILCPFNPAFNSLNTAYNAASLAAVPAAKGAPSVAVFSATSEYDISQQDVNAFASAFGLPPPQVTLAYSDASACPSIAACGTAGYQEEMSLDLQMLETSAPGANIQIFASGSLRQALNQVVAQDSVRVFSISYGAGEMAEYAYDQSAQTGWDVLAQMATVEGITISVAAGDGGAFEGAQYGLASPMPSYPSNSPWVSALGATETSVGTQGGVLESALWGGNLGGELPTPTLLSFLSMENMMGGGGISRLEPAPLYQRLASPPYAGRVNPDFSFQGSVVTPGILGFYGGTGNEALYLFGGTSADAPLFAGWVADMGQALGRNLGLVNVPIYTLGRTDRALLSPVRFGNNGAYAVTPGLNPVNGLGVLNMGRLLQDLGVLEPSGPGGAPGQGAPSPTGSGAATGH